MRWLLALTVVANLLFFAWTQGSLDWLVGARAIGDREPERMAREVRPDAVKVTPMSSAPGTGRDDAVCLESGPYSPNEVAPAEVALSVLVPPGTWSNLRQERPGQWIVYLGPLADKEALARKEDEVKRLQVPYEAIKERGELDYGLSLGRFARLNEANAALDRLAQQPALRNARVVTLVQPTAVHVLRIEAASAAVAQRLQEQEGKSSALKAFATCPKS